MSSRNDHLALSDSRLHAQAGELDVEGALIRIIGLDVKDGIAFAAGGRLEPHPEECVGSQHERCLRRRGNDEVALLATGEGDGQALKFFTSVICDHEQLVSAGRADLGRSEFFLGRAIHQLAADRLLDVDLGSGCRDDRPVTEPFGRGEAGFSLHIVNCEALAAVEKNRRSHGRRIAPEKCAGEVFAILERGVPMEVTLLGMERLVKPLQP